MAFFPRAKHRPGGFGSKAGTEQHMARRFALLAKNSHPSSCVTRSLATMCPSYKSAPPFHHRFGNSELNP